MHEAGRICRLIDPTCHSNVEHRCKQSAINSLKVLLAGGGHLPRSDSMVGFGGGGALGKPVSNDFNWRKD